MTGIYKITNIVNGKVYIGQAKDIEIRWKEHITHSKTRKQILYNAMRKHGIENFNFEILMLCEEELLDLMEIYYIKQYNSYIGWENNNGYNMTTGGSGVRRIVISKKERKRMSEIKKGKYCGDKNPMFGRHHTEDAKKKVSIANKGRVLSEEHKKKISKANKGKLCGSKHPNYGKHLSSETKNKISNSVKGENNGFYGKRHTAETKEKLSIARSGKNNNNSIRVTCDNIIFNCISLCADYCGIKKKTMEGWLAGRRGMPKEFYDRGLDYVDIESKRWLAKRKSTYKPNEIIK